MPGEIEVPYNRVKELTAKYNLSVSVVASLVVPRVHCLVHWYNKLPVAAYESY